MGAKTRNHREYCDRLLRVHCIHGELSASGVANAAAFSKRIGIGEEVRGLSFGNVASAAGRCYRLHWIDPALRVDDLIQASGQNLLAAIDVAQGAVL